MAKIVFLGSHTHIYVSVIHWLTCSTVGSEDAGSILGRVGQLKSKSFGTEAKPSVLCYNKC